MPYGYAPAAVVESPPVGTILDWAGGAVPAGWLECNGQEVLVADYPALAAVLRPIITGSYSSGYGDVFDIPAADYAKLALGMYIKGTAIEGYIASGMQPGQFICSAQATDDAEADSILCHLWGEGSDLDHFRLPDLRQRVRVGQDPDTPAGVPSMEHLPGRFGGEGDHTITEAELPAHSHGGPAHTHSGGLGDVTTDEVAEGEGSTKEVVVGVSDADTGEAGDGSTGETGSGEAINLTQPYLVVTAIVKAR